MPRAARERVRRWRTGQSRCRFWHLIQKDCLFFRGVPFPEDGWYAPRDGVRPIAARARLEVAAGRLRVVLANCYPALGTVSIDVFVNGQPVARLETHDRDERVLDTPAGELVFVARRIFLAEETGEAFDCGGWLAVELLPLSRAKEVVA